MTNCAGKPAEEPPHVQILVSVAIVLVRSQKSEARKGSRTMSISSGSVGPKVELYCAKWGHLHGLPHQLKGKRVNILAHGMGRPAATRRKKSRQAGRAEEGMSSLFNGFYHE